MPAVGTMLETQRPDDWDATRRNQQVTEKHLRPPMPNVRVRRAAATNINNNTATAISFDTELWDVGGFHDNAVNPSRLIAPITGLYYIQATAGFAAAATGIREAWIAFNGTGTAIADESEAGSAAGASTFNMSTIYRLSKGQYVELFVFQTSGGALALSVFNDYAPSMTMVRLGGYTNEGVANP